MAAQQGLSEAIKTELINLGIGQLRSVMNQPPPNLAPEPEIPEIEEEKTKCAICLEELETCATGFKNVIFTPCGHPFHPHCINRLQGEKACPVCRTSLGDDDIDNLQEAARNAVDAEDARDNHNLLWQLQQLEPPPL